MFELIHSLEIAAGNFISHQAWPFWTLCFTILVAICGLWVKFRGKQVTYRVRLNDPVIRPDAVHNNLQISYKGNPLQDPTLVILRVTHTGVTAITDKDYHIPIQFSFTGREVKGSEISETKPVILRQAFDKKIVEETNGIKLPTVPLNRGNWVEILVWLSGHGRGVDGGAHIKGGFLRKDQSHPIFKIKNFAMALAWVFVILLIGGAITPIGDQTANGIKCASGSIKVGGSTAFDPLLEKVAQSYTSQCQKATITIAEDSSSSAIQDVAQQTRDIGTSELAPDRSSYPRLVDNPIMINTFALVVNKDLGITNLSTSQIQSIFAGTYPSWDQVPNLNGPKIPITIVNRTTTSGTRKTFEKYVLRTSTQQPPTSNNCQKFDAQVRRCEVDSTTNVLQTVSGIKGAIGYADLAEAIANSRLTELSIDGIKPQQQDKVENNTYKFWSVEHMITDGYPLTDSLTKTFINYVNSDFVISGIASDMYYISYNKMQSEALLSHN